VKMDIETHVDMRKFMRCKELGKGQNIFGHRRGLGGIWAPDLRRIPRFGVGVGFLWNGRKVVSRKDAKPQRARGKGELAIVIHFKQVVVVGFREGGWIVYNPAKRGCNLIDENRFPKGERKRAEIFGWPTLDKLKGFDRIGSIEGAVFP
jgi:hypothetical protein